MRALKETLFFLTGGILLTVVLTATLLCQTPDLGAKFRLAQGYEQAGDYERAADLYRELLVRDPSNVVFFDGLQRVLLQLKQYDEAVQRIQARLTSNPSDLNLRAQLGTVYYRAGREQEAFAEWDRAVALAPANPQYYRVIASVMIENRLFDRAAGIYRSARAATGDPNLFTMELAQILTFTLEYGGATEEYIRWLTLNPMQLSFVQNRLSTFTWKPDGRAAAMSAVRAALARSDDLRLYELLGWLHLEGKEFGAALEVQRSIDRLSNAQGVSLLTFADRVFRERAFDVAADAYREAIEMPVTPQRLPHAKFGYASALKEMSIPVDSTGGSLAATLFPPSEARVRLEGALGRFAQIINEYPSSEYSARSYYQIGLIQFRQFHDLDNARRALEQVLREPFVRNVLRYDVALRLGEIHLAGADTVGAAVRFRSVVAAALLNMLSVNVKADFANDALALQSVLEDNEGTSREALTMFGRAEFLARQEKKSEAVGVLLELVERYPQAPLADRAFLRAATLQAETGQYREALATLDTLLTGHRQGATILDRAQFRAAEILQYGLNNAPAAITAYEQLLADYPQSIFASEARRRIRMLRGDTL
jgi:tetratricopeptide (TPR) repeat protein